MADRPRLVVVGSANLDLVVGCEQIPRAGETIVGSRFKTIPGGKGANQAVAASRLGAHVTFVGRIGLDAFGDRLATEIGSAGVDLSRLVRDHANPTGVALISVDSAGQNAIVVAPGANAALTPEDVDLAEPEIAACGAMIVQLEIETATVAHAIAVARRHGTRVVMNPAPVHGANREMATMLSSVDVLTPNEHEAANLMGYDSPDGLDMAELARALALCGPNLVVITLGENGCVYATAQGACYVGAVPVRAVDTTAAGDCFTGALAVALVERKPIAEAVGFAVRAAGISVTRAGAQPSAPSRAEVDAIR